MLVAPLLVGCGERGAAATRPATAAVAAPPQLPMRIAADLVIKRAEFGLLQTMPDGEEKFVPTDELPADEGQTFGWVLQVETTRDSIHWSERLHAPHAIADWGDAASDPDILISKDGLSAVAQGNELVDEGEVSRFYWALVSGDPAGAWELDLAVEGKPVAKFRFKVPATVREKPLLVRRATQRMRVQLVAVSTAPANPGAPAWK